MSTPTPVSKYSVRLTDGSVLTEELSSARAPDLPRLLEHANAVSYHAATPHERVQILTVLSKNMPRLKHLDIAVQHPTDGKAAHPTIIDIPVKRFPALEALCLAGVRTNLTAPFLPNLCHLSLKDYPGVERCLPVPQFLAAMASCPRLESLKIHNYGNAILAGTPRTPVVFRSLKDLTISDTPWAVALLLEYLEAPATTNHYIVVDIRKGNYRADFGATFAVALPLDRRTLSILREVKAVEVLQIGSTYRVVGTTPHKSRLIIEIDVDAEPQLGAMSRSGLYESILRNVGRIFGNSPAHIASFIGDFTEVTIDAWRAAFLALPGLTHLEFDDRGNHSPDRLPLLSALGISDITTNGAPPWFPCPKLRSLGVRGRYGSRVIMGARECLERRQAAGVTDLAKFKILMVLSADRVRGQEEELTYRKNALLRLGVRCDLAFK